ncbi:MAG: DUF58 domain-containing protein [Anaerolineae bacterium]
MANEPLLLEEATRRKLDQLTLVASKVRAGAIKGERRSTKRGTSIEFADYRNYAPGDDLRRMDWNVYARLDRPYIKLLEDEEDLAVHILMDTSGSMNWPTGGDIPQDYNKRVFASRLLAGLAYVSLGSNDRLTITALREGNTEQFGPVRGRGQSVPMLRFAHSLKAAGVTNLNASLYDYAVRSRRPGLCFIISDMFSPEGYIEGLNALLGKGNEVVLLHVLSPDEITPPLVGDLRLVDAENGTAQEVSLDAGMRELYTRRVQEWRDGIRAECARRGVHYLALQTDMAWEKVLLYDLRKMGLVK